MSKTTRALGVFAKEPRTGQVKTRLAAATSSAWAARAAEAFLRDTLGRMVNVRAERFLAYSPPGAADYFQSLASDRYQSLPQGEGDLGQRLRRFFADRLALGFQRIVVIGTDSPTLPPANVERAFEKLASADVVLGPASDGGYYLVGLARQMPDIFEGVTWGSAKVLDQTVARLPRDGCRLALLQPWYDVDSPDDWQTLRGHIMAIRRAGDDPQVPHTERLMIQEKR